MATALPLPHRDVELTADAVHVAELTETDPTVVAVLHAADDPTEGVHQCLRIGAQAIRAVSATVDTLVVEQRFDAMTNRFDERVDAAIAQIATTAHDLLDGDDGSLTHAFGAHRDALEALLGAAFDPDSKRSVLALFESVVCAAFTRQADAVRQLVAVDGDDSPLARLKVEMSRDLRDQLGSVRAEVQELSEKVAVSAATAEVYELTPQKGFTFEAAVHEALATIAGAHGDTAEPTGTELGSAGTKKGDEVVTLNREDTHGGEARFVVEMKDRKLTRRQTHAELEAARVNRAATAAIAVFRRQDQAPTGVPFAYSDDEAIVVFDPGAGDDGALRLGYMWARWVVRRERADAEADELDVERVTALLATAARGLEHMTSIKRSNTQAKRSIDQAQEHALAMVTEVRDALDQLEELIG